jgi:hypothetical protein
MEGNGQKCVPIITIQRALNAVIKKFGHLLKEVSMPFTSPSFADDMMYTKTMSYTFLSLNLSIFYRVVKDIGDTFYASLRLYPNGLKAIVLCLQV